MGLLDAFRFTLKSQVDFYVKKYAQLQSQGCSKEQIVNALTEFYLQHEPLWKKEHMIDQHETYVQNIDIVIQDIILFQFVYGKTSYYDQNADRLKQSEKFVTVVAETSKYLVFYKTKYGLQMPHGNRSDDDYTIFKCLQCNQKLRIPIKKELLKITCSSCNNIFHFQDGKKI